MHLEQYESAVADFKTAIEHAQSEGAMSDERSLKTELKKAEVALKRSKTKDYYKILGKSSILRRVSGYLMIFDRL